MDRQSFQGHSEDQRTDEQTDIVSFHRQQARQTDRRKSTENKQTYSQKEKTLYILLLFIICYFLYFIQTPPTQWKCKITVVVVRADNIIYKTTGTFYREA